VRGILFCLVSLGNLGAVNKFWIPCIMVVPSLLHSSRRTFPHPSSRAQYKTVSHPDLPHDYPKAVARPRIPAISTNSLHDPPCHSYVKPEMNITGWNLRGFCYSFLFQSEQKWPRLPDSNLFESGMLGFAWKIFYLKHSEFNVCIVDIPLWLL